MYFDMGMMYMKYRVIQRKLNLLKHISTLDKDSIPYLIYKEQKTKPNLPGLVEECRTYLRNIGLSVNQMEKYSKNQWKMLIRKTLREVNEKELKEEAKSMKKIDSMRMNMENFELQEYLTKLPYKDGLFKMP